MSKGLLIAFEDRQHMQQLHCCCIADNGHHWLVHHAEWAHMDLILTGMEASLWVAEQFALDLKVFLCIRHAASQL